MKKIILLLLIAFVFLGCRGLNKVQTNSTIIDSLQVHISKTTSTLSDTSKTTNTITRMVNIIYDPNCDSARVIIGTESYTGKIKSATVTTISKYKDKKGITKTDSSTDEVAIHKINSTTATKTDVAKDPYRWRWIFGIAIVVLAILIFAYYQLKPILTTFKPLAYLKKIFNK